MTVDPTQRPVPGANAPLLDPEMAQAWRETGAQLRRTLIKARSGLPLTPEDFELPPLDQDQLRHAILIPEDAGELAPALEAMLRRVPDNWGRIVGCDRGWYPLVVQLDRDLAQLWKTLCPRCGLAEDLLPVEVSPWEGGR